MYSMTSLTKVAHYWSHKLREYQARWTKTEHEFCELVKLVPHPDLYKSLRRWVNPQVMITVLEIDVCHEVVPLQHGRKKLHGLVTATGLRQVVVYVTKIDDQPPLPWFLFRLQSAMRNMSVNAVNEGVGDRSRVSKNASVIRGSEVCRQVHCKCGGSIFESYSAAGHLLNVYDCRG